MNVDRALHTFVPKGLQKSILVPNFYDETSWKILLSTDKPDTSGFTLRSKVGTAKSQAPIYLRFRYSYPQLLTGASRPIGNVYASIGRRLMRIVRDSVLEW